jgi:hypothetical protein
MQSNWAMSMTKDPRSYDVVAVRVVENRNAQNICAGPSVRVPTGEFCQQFLEQRPQFILDFACLCAFLWAGSEWRSPVRLVQ